MRVFYRQMIKCMKCGQISTTSQLFQDIPCDIGKSANVLDLVSNATKLAPRNRAPLTELLRMALFVKNRSKLSESERKANLLALLAKLN